MIITTLFSYSFCDFNRLLAITLLLCEFSFPGMSFQVPKRDSVQPAGDNATVKSLQIADTSIINKDTINRMIQAEYPGGRSGWLRFLSRNFRYPEEAFARNIQGQVIVKFQVDEKGRLKDLFAVTGPKELTKEAIRVVKESGRWKPAQLNGEPVISEKTQIITFKRETPGGFLTPETNRIPDSTAPQAVGGRSLIPWWTFRVDAVYESKLSLSCGGCFDEATGCGHRSIYGK